MRYVRESPPPGYRLSRYTSDMLATHVSSNLNLHSARTSALCSLSCYHMLAHTSENDSGVFKTTI
jgi:hypothetical protein